MQATVVKVVVADGDAVAEGDLVAVLEAMKMEQPLNAHRSGTVSGLAVEVGGTVTAGRGGLRDQLGAGAPGAQPIGLGCSRRAASAIEPDRLG
jgi:hypothetical protein